MIDHPTCIFIFFLKTAHFMTQLKRKQKGHCFFVFMPTPRKKVCIIQMEFAIPSGAGE